MTCASIHLLVGPALEAGQCSTKGFNPPRRVGRQAYKIELTIFHANLHQSTLGELAEQQLLRERFFDVLLNHTAKRASAHFLVIALIREPLRGFFGQFEHDIAVGELIAS